MSTRLDYDTIAEVYDARRRDYAADDRLTAFLEERGLSPSNTRVLDVGCGTGKQLAANRGRYPRARLVGVDRSAGMLRVARRRAPDVVWVQGDAQRLPLPTAAFDYATNQFSYPHIPDKAAFAAEVFRVLRPGGRMVVTNIDPWTMPGWALYRFFPEARTLDERDFLPAEALRSLLVSAGFVDIEAAVTDRSCDEALSDVLASVSRRHSASQLVALDDAAYHAGVRRVRAALDAGTAAVRSDMTILTVCGDKPV